VEGLGAMLTGYTRMKDEKEKECEKLVRYFKKITEI
jgi:hypothetical protein